MVGIRDLARHLNISIGTVSRALNDRADVNKETRKKVLEAAEELGYVANQSGRSLRQGTTNAIGFMIESGTETAANNDNFFAGVIDGLQSGLAKHQLDLVVLPCSTEEDSEAFLKRMVARQIVDGVIITATNRFDARIPYLTKAKIPFVALGRSQVESDYTWIDLDFEGVARRSIDRLVKQGHRRIALSLPNTDVNLGYLFLEGYKSALEKNGLVFDPKLVLRARSSEQGGYAIGDDLLRIEDRPTAILLIYELMAYGLYRRLTEEGLRPGIDLAIIGMRDSPQSKFLSPNLTCFHLELRELGIALAEALLSNMPTYAQFYPDVPQGKIWPMQLVEGESDAIFISREPPHF